ncbi:M56 family metallopeptidase [Neolewinella agarilytica]|uniref:Signal transducer regulating beta-lactamase production, contains metallopeptidase domain n=1 Tax=Neolewinella agarilytica TaxID=478744 RepID=A0A1H8ZE72_9BACT|nr:M56 family metallopeptidase [Neolewinella agarilytica]SEP62681.1 Signal transducer regulating beta-lactamase production, contains metallopeptidase domain [Neolewinella agarilytica]
MNYLLTATILLFALWPAYYLLLRYSERYSLNRLLLLLAMVAVCALPFVELESPAPVVTQSVQGTITLMEETIAPIEALPPATSETFFVDDSVQPEIHVPVTKAPVPKLYLIYGVVSLLSFLLLGLRLAFILRLHLRSRPNGDGSYRLLHPSAKPGQAFTFGHLLYFSIDVPDDGDFEHILAHERVHARQFHTVDILISEVFLCLFWFHPTAWWLRTKMRANLEYLVDKEVVKRGSDRRSYQLALVRQSQAAQGLALALPFSEPSLKSRIVRLSGMPEYRLVGVAAALGLLLWLGIAMVTLNGTMTDLTHPSSGSYLAAYAEKGDPYYDYYQGILPQEITSIEVYTDRMVTVDEYLQLRAILSKVPGTRLYLYKAPFDKNYSLELQYGQNSPARVNYLPPVPDHKMVRMIGLDRNSSLEEKVKGFIPLSVTYDVEKKIVETMIGDKIKHPIISGGYFSRVLEATLPELSEGKLRVLVNQEPLELLPPGTNFIAGEDGPTDGFTVNGYPLNELGVEDWPKIVVEGRQMPRPVDRLRKILGEDSFEGVGSSFLTHTVETGTFRQAFEDIDWPPGQSIVAYYNDRKVSLDFLLDTEFGPEAFLSTGVVYDTHMGRYAVQVIDDSPYDQVTLVEIKVPTVEDPMDLSGIEEIDFYFKRLPTPAEVESIRSYLAGFPGYDLRVFQDCNYPFGNYTLYLGDAHGSMKGFSKVTVGESFEKPLRFKLKRSNSGAVDVEMFKPEVPDSDIGNAEIILIVDGVYVGVHESSVEPYNKATLDPPPAQVSLKCKSNTLPSFFNRGFWSYIYRSTGPEMMDDLFAMRDKHGYSDHEMVFFIGERPVDIGEFGNYVGGADSYVQMGTWTEIDHAPLVLQIVE